MVGGIIKRRSNTEGPVSALSEDTELDKEGFRELLTSIDRGLRALPATAQVHTEYCTFQLGDDTPAGVWALGWYPMSLHCPMRPNHANPSRCPCCKAIPASNAGHAAPSQVAKQQGEFLAKLLTSGKAVPGQPMKDVKPFRYTHRGSLAYVGRDKAVMDVPNVGPLFGWQAGDCDLLFVSCASCLTAVAPLQVTCLLRNHGCNLLQVWHGRASRPTASSVRAT